MLVVFTPKNPIKESLDKFLEVSGLYKKGKVSEEVLREASEKYQYVVNMYKWRSE